MAMPEECPVFFHSLFFLQAFCHMHPLSRKIFIGIPSEKKWRAEHRQEPGLCPNGTDRATGLWNGRLVHTGFRRYCPYDLMMKNLSCTVPYS